MHERNSPGGDTFEQTIVYEVYLKGRDEPVAVNATFELRKETLEDGKELEGMMQIATNHLMATLDVVREHRFILSDERFNKFVFLTEEMQAVSILAPDRDTLLEALED